VRLRRLSLLLSIAVALPLLAAPVAADVVTRGPAAAAEPLRAAPSTPPLHAASGATTTTTGAAAAGADGLVALQVPDGEHVVRGEHVVAGWWSLPVGSLGLARADLVARGVPVLDQVPVGRVAATGTAEPGSTPGEPVSPGDPDSDLQWHLAEIEVPRAWRHSRGAGVRVAILDSGVTPGPDLACRDFVAEFDATGGTGPVEDSSGHGTHVAGTIGQCSGNGIGTAGVAPDVDLLDVKVLGGDPSQPDAGNSRDLAEGILFAVEAGADVLNLSLAGSCSSAEPTWEAGCNDPFVDAAIQVAADAGVLVVAASGNDGSNRLSYPANHPLVVAVGALDASRRVPVYASRGPGLDLAAPGGVVEDSDGDGILDYVYQESYDPELGDHAIFGMVGTSMAAPHVAGVAALLLAADHGLAPQDLVATLLVSACDVGTPGRDDATGAGIVQAANALRVLLRSGEVPTCFRDVPLASAFAPDVAFLADGGITLGCDPPLLTRFCPLEVVTRGQMAAFLDRALLLDDSGEDRFVDDDGSPFEDSVQALAAAGITRGCGSDDAGGELFCPAAPITRAEMAQLLVVALELLPSAEDRFVDDDDGPFEDAIQALAASGVTRGCNPPTNDRFCGSDPVRRQEMAAFLQRGLTLEAPAPTGDGA